MVTLDTLLACSGSWTGTNRLHDPHTGSPDESPSTLTITPVLNGRFIRLEYTWTYRRSPQAGTILIGHDKSGNEATAHWIDTWHMGDKVLACRGPIGDNAPLSVVGSYAAPPGPDWGWRTVIAPAEKSLRIVMFNIAPDGQEDLAVEMEYRRA